ncbi:helix-turn-helix domain-containing protein [Paenibacillus larvae]|uniref:DNA binding domain, excisionase family n=1 Tax=Paenibacillus larvae subsp. larvae TaxID=147375 RepID=A0A6C0QVU7_9BACL|nr:helix-turn-helix domain-containing protein [Paenibacillus larvae]QHZ52468.1 DNA binding domain, excisionase family [Paenibacillus larvae subsp. larvae]
MTAVEKAIADMVAAQVAEAEKRILERLSIPEDRTLTFAEACKYLHVSEYTLRQLCREKRIPHRVIGSEGSRKPKYLFSTVSLDRWTREEEKRNYRL